MSKIHPSEYSSNNIILENSFDNIILDKLGDINIDIDTGKEDPGEKYNVNYKFNIFVGLREVKKSYTGENIPYQSEKPFYETDKNTIINDSEKIQDDYINKFRTYLGEVSKIVNINNIIPVLEVPLYPGMNNQVNDEQFNPEFGPEILKEYYNLQNIEENPPSIEGGGYVDCFRHHNGLSATSTEFEGSFTVKEKWHIFSSQVGKALELHKSEPDPDEPEPEPEYTTMREDNKPTTAIVFAHHHTFRSMLNINEYSGKKIGINNNSMLIFTRSESKSESKLSIDLINLKNKGIFNCERNVKNKSILNPKIKQVTLKRLTEFYGLDKDYNYECINLEGILDDYIVKIIYDSMKNNELNRLIFYRHGNSLHNLMGMFDKGRYCEIINNSRLLPGDMLKGGAIHYQAEKLYKYLYSNGGLEDNILWISSELTRAFQTLITFRYGYELALNKDADLVDIYNDARIKCLKHSLQPSVRDALSKIFNRDKKKDKDNRRLLDSIIAIHKYENNALDTELTIEDREELDTTPYETISKEKIFTELNNQDYEFMKLMTFKS